MTAGRPAQQDPVVTFFMIVTDRDCVIADYAIRSFARLRDVPFKLIVYSNWLLRELRERYFPRWRSLPFVEIREDRERTDETKPDDPALWGPFELGYTIWDRELPLLVDTPFHAIVDADFEILDGRFVRPMLEALTADDRLVAMSTDCSQTVPERYDTYTAQTIELMERCHTHFLIYKREALEHRTSYRARVELSRDGAHRRVWDDHAWFQQQLRERHGYRLAALPGRYRRCYVHYGAFGHNRDITEENVALYRRVQLLRRHGAFRLGDPLTRFFGAVLDRALFGKVNRGSYVPGWGRSEYADIVRQ